MFPLCLGCPVPMWTHPYHIISYTFIKEVVKTQLQNTDVEQNRINAIAEYTVCLKKNTQLNSPSKAATRKDKQNKER